MKTNISSMKFKSDNSHEYPFHIGYNFFKVWCRHFVVKAFQLRYYTGVKRRHYGVKGVASKSVIMEERVKYWMVKTSCFFIDINFVVNVTKWCRNCVFSSNFHQIVMFIVPLLPLYKIIRRICFLFCFVFDKWLFTACKWIIIFIYLICIYFCSCLHLLIICKCLNK